jgi:hypothetical protein
VEQEEIPAPALLDDGTRMKILSAFSALEEPIGKEELESAVGIPVEEWTVDEKTVLLNKWKALKAGTLTKSQFIQ